MRDFDAEIVDLLCTEPLVRGVYRKPNGPDSVGRYAVCHDDANDDVTELLRDKLFDALGVTLDVEFIDTYDPYWRPLWERGVDYVDGTARVHTVHRGPAKTRRRLPTITELIAHNRAHFLAERNRLTAVEGLPGIAVCAFVIDVADRHCPPKFRTLAGGDEFIATCRSRKDLPLAIGVMPRDVMIKHVTPIARALEGTQPSMIIMADPVEPAVPHLLRGWKDAGRMPIVTIYKGKLGVFDTPVPAILSPAHVKMPSRTQ